MHGIFSVALLLLLSPLLLLTNCTVTFTKNFPNPFKADTSKPNIVFILTDDQDVSLGGMTPMAKVKKLLQEQGTTFNNMFVTTPLCCPSRSSILTGRYSHNTGVVNNSISGNCSSPYFQKNMETKSMAVQLKKAGYSTYFAGKYLNQYGRVKAGGVAHVPAGWDHWFGLVGNSQYYNYSISNEGREVKHGGSFEKDYLTDVLKNRSLEAIESLSKEWFRSPFFLMISTPAPHSPWDAAPQYQDKYKDMTAPKTASYNKPGKDKHWLIRQATNPMKDSSVSYLNEAFRGRWRSLLSVDDLVGDVVDSLTKNGFIDNTYIVYSSDNGYHLGQFSLPIDKRQLYDFDLRVPLIVRGPGVSKNVTRDEAVLNIDIAPTFTDIAGAFDASMDGASMKPLFNVGRVSFFSFVLR